MRIRVDEMLNFRKLITIILFIGMILNLSIPVFAFEFGDPPTETCVNCGKTRTFYSGQWTTTKDVYGVESIPGLGELLLGDSNSIEWDFSNHLCNTCVDSIAQAYLATLNRITTAGGTGTVPLVVSTEIPTFSVTVPTSLPVTVQSNGTVVVSNACKIVNNGPGVVEITNIQVNNSNGWNLVDFNTNFDSLENGIRYFGISLFGNNVQTNGTCNVSTISQINGKSNINVGYNVKIAPQTQAISSSTIANVIFTVSWKLAPVSIIDFQIDGKTYQAVEGMTWSSWINSDYNTGLGTDSIVADGDKVGIESFVGSSSLFVGYVGYEEVYVKLTDSIIDGRSYTQVAPDPVISLISFTIEYGKIRPTNSVSCTGVDGMTVEEWVNSEYNTIGASIIYGSKLSYKGYGGEPDSSDATYIIHDGTVLRSVGPT